MNVKFPFISHCERCSKDLQIANLRPMVWCVEHIPTSLGKTPEGVASAGFCSTKCAMEWLAGIDKRSS